MGSELLCFQPDEIHAKRFHAWHENIFMILYSQKRYFVHGLLTESLPVTHYQKCAPVVINHANRQNGPYIAVVGNLSEAACYLIRLSQQNKSPLNQIWPRKIEHNREKQPLTQ
jgi:hypothetical protein